MDKGYTPLPDVLIDHIRENDWWILEVCGGNGYNVKKLKDKNISVISFDIMENDNVKYGVAGTFEHKHSCRTLLLCSAMDANISVSNYQKGGGKRVILGGYLTPVKVRIDGEIHLIDNMASTDIISLKIYSYVEDLQSKANGYSIDVRPNPRWMKEHNWKLVSTYYNVSNEKDSCVPLRIFQIWELNV